jgi:hypothetical protein
MVAKSSEWVLIQIVMKTLLLSQLFVLGLVMFLHTDVLACKCSRQDGESLQQRVTQAKTDANAVFSAKVLAVAVNRREFSVSVKLSVEQVWKGEVAKEVTLTTGSGGGDCGYPFKVGESYLVYANASEGGLLSTGICSRTNKLSASAQDVKILGKGKPAAITNLMHNGNPIRTSKATTLNRNRAKTKDY